MIDLHTHSTASDGTLTPEALVDLAVEKGLRAIALTDHDTVEGIPRALARGIKRGLEVIPGVELSALWAAPGQMHILGYYIDYRHRELAERLSWLSARRAERAKQIVRRLGELSVPVSWERVKRLAGGASLGRPHIARALAEAGHVKSLAEAFDRYLKEGAPGFVEKIQLSPHECIRLIRRASGVAVLAHPGTLKLRPQAFCALLSQLVNDGLAGLEAYWSKHKPAETAFYADLGRRFGLVLTGGSDFHGDNKPGIELGKYPSEGRGDADGPLRGLKLRRAGSARSTGPGRRNRFSVASPRGVAGPMR